MQLKFNDSVIFIDKSKNNLEIYSNNTSSQPKIHQNRLRNSITIDLIDTNQNKMNNSLSTGPFTDVQLSNTNIIPRVRSFKSSKKTIYANGKEDSINKINLSQDIDLDKTVGFTNSNLNQRIRSAHSASVKLKNSREKYK